MTGRKRRAKSLRDRVVGARGVDARNEFVFVDAASMGPTTIASARRLLTKSFHEAVGPREAEKKVVIYNISTGDKRSWLKIKPARAGLVKIARKICAGLSDGKMIDYCYRNMAIFERERPSIELLSRGFRHMSLHNAIRRRERELVATNLSSELDEIVRAEKDNPGALFDGPELAREVDRITREAKVALSASQKRSKLEAR